MKIGFIGAGKMGFTIGKHFTEAIRQGILNDIDVVGYYSRSCESAKEAAKFTDTKYYENLVELVSDSDTIFVTVPDGQIAVIANMLDGLDVSLDGKKLIHMSGACTSEIFSGMKKTVYGFSIHPIYAVNSKTDSYIQFSKCFITIEYEAIKCIQDGLSCSLYDEYAKELYDLFTKLGHSVKYIQAKDKVKYHASAVFASNLVVGLYHMGAGLLKQCGFTEDEAEQALLPLFENNANNIVNVGCNKALTGPVARCDKSTVENHLQHLDGNEKKVYQLLSQELISLARKNALDISANAEHDVEINENYNSLLQLLKDY